MGNTPSIPQTFNSSNMGDMPPTPKQGIDPYTDQAAISKRIDYFAQRDRFTRWLFEREWFRNVLFYIGKQWIIYSITNRRWRPRSLPNWFPQPVTNKFAEKANDIISAMAQGRVPIVYNPATDDPADMAIAEVGERFREVLYEEANVDDKEMLLAAWVTLCGNGFIHTYYDYDNSFGKKFVQSWQCPQCGNVMKASDLMQSAGKCPQCGAGDMMPAKDPTGQAIGEELPVGRLHADILSPFEWRVDPTIPDHENQRRGIRVRTYDLEYARQYWGGKPDVTGKPIDPKEIVADKESSIGQFYLDALSYITGTFGAGGGFVAGSGSAFRLPRVTAYEFYELPSDDFPDGGLHAIRLGHGERMVVQAEPLPDKYGAGIKRGQPFIPVTRFGADVVPGRYWRKTRMDDMISPQVFRNLIEAALKLTAQRSGNPIWLNPKGSGLTNVTGEPGGFYDYNPISLGGTSFAKPERVPADLSNFQSFLILMKEIDDEMDRVAGTFFLTGGTTPPGVTAASALSYLGERAERSMSPIKREWAKSWKTWEEQALEIARAHMDEARVRIVAGKNKRWSVEKFMNADLVGGVNLTIDYNGLFKKSPATKRADIQLLTELGYVTPGDPSTDWKVLEAFGETALKGSTDLDMQEAIKESDDFLTHGIPPKIVPLVQNSQVHILQHTDFAKTDEFKELPQEMQDFWFQHIEAHYQDMIQRQMTMGMVAGAASGGMPPQGGGGDPNAQPGSGGKEPGPVKKGKGRAAAEQQVPLQEAPPAS